MSDQVSLRPVLCHGGQMRDVVVVGSGPNGLAAAVICARAGLEVEVLEANDSPGGGVRAEPVETEHVPASAGLVRDVCATSPAAATSSPFFRWFDLESHGVQLLRPEVSYAHPLDGGRAGVAHRDLEATAAGLGDDGRRWRRLFGPLARDNHALAALALGDKRSLPGELRSTGGARTTAAFARAVSLLATPFADSHWHTPEASALLTGVAAHAIGPLPSAGSAGAAAFLGGLAHGDGWPLVQGGIGQITHALVSDLEVHGGQLRLGQHVRSKADLPAARAYIFDTHAQVLAAMLNDPWRSRLRQLRPGGAASKVDLVLDGPIPWANADVGRAGTVHIGGTTEQIRQAEAQIAAGRHADQPMMLVSDPAVHDPSREHAGLRPIWTYAHVPRGSTRDVTSEALAQLERFAPGVRDLVVDSVATPAERMSAHNPSLIEGDISAGDTGLWSMVARPYATVDPYRVAEGIYLCSASTPPGPGVHGMGGWHAARRVLRDLT